MRHPSRLEVLLALWSWYLDDEIFVALWKWLTSRTKESFKCILLLWHSVALSWENERLFGCATSPENRCHLSSSHRDDETPAVDGDSRISTNCRNIFKSSERKLRQFPLLEWPLNVQCGKSMEFSELKGNLIPDEFPQLFPPLSRLDQFDIEILSFVFSSAVIIDF